MRYAILSDVHGRRHKLEAALNDALARKVDRIISLGDVGGDECLALLRQVGAMNVFGNYEVSGWQQLAPKHRAWVCDWPPLLVGDSFLAVHAAPWWPAGLSTIEDFGHWIKTSGKSWRSLFPYLNEDEDYLWQALAELENADKAALFHGHTHQQAIWQWRPTGHLRQGQASHIDIEPDCHYLVGVGSVGLPQDNCWAAYALFDSDQNRIELIRINQPPT